MIIEEFQSMPYLMISILWGKFEFSYQPVNLEKKKRLK